MSESTIVEWLHQFDSADRDLAARVLDAVEFYNAARISTAYQSVFNSLPGWSKDAKKRTGRWFFAPYSGSSGESGDSMLHRFRVANGLSVERFAPMFVYRSDLPSKELTSDDTVVFVDDVSASGNQVSKVWKTGLGELVAGAGTVYLIVVVAGHRAKKRVSSDTQLCLVAAHELDESASLFEEACQHFSANEKERLLEYCKKANPKFPKGFDSCGYLLVFQHRCPNNTVPILHAISDDWFGLFPRN